MSVCQKHQKPIENVQVVQGFRCFECGHEYTWEDAGSVTNPRFPNDPIEDYMCCPKCGDLTDGCGSKFDHEHKVIYIEIETD